LSDAVRDGDVIYSLEGPAAYITIDRPQRRNALSPDVVRGISTHISAAQEDPRARAIVLTGAGDAAFCAGADLGTMSDVGAVAQHFVRAEIGGLFAKMRAARLPIVARVNGLALAGGFGLMLACDLVVAADDVEMGMPEINLGLWPFMISAVVQRDIPRKVALDLMLTGRRLDAAAAERFGFVSRVVAREQLDATVGEVVDELSSKSPLILSLGKRSFYNAEDMDFDAALEYLSGMLSVCLQSEDTAEGVSAFFAKRSPEWKGR
jgi:enoyl-CoA hydratase